MDTQILDLGTHLRATPSRWIDLTAEQQALLIAAFRPHPRYGFVPEQMDWIRRWWLDCTDTDLSGVTALNGRRYVCADLLSDALEGRRLAKMLPTLKVLTLVYQPEFPQQKEEV